MKLKSIKNVKRLEGKRVLVRIDANVPIVDGKAVDGDYGRIAQAADGINWLLARKVRVIIVAHLGRPGGKKQRSLTMAPIAVRLDELLTSHVSYNGALKGEGLTKLIHRLRPGRAALLENIRFDKREELNDISFAKELAKHADIYVNDAFGVSHRAHASVSAIQELLPSYAGPILVRETAELEKITKKPKRPFILILGGLKIETKIGTLENLAPKTTKILLAGAFATTFLAAEGHKVGRSFYEKSEVKLAKSLLEKYRKKLVLPSDVAVVRNTKKDHDPHSVLVDDMKRTDVIIDIGRKTMRTYLRLMQGAKTIVWNGPIGMCEVSEFCVGTRMIARGIAAIDGAEKIVGGGDTLPIISSENIGHRFSLVSTGGGAMLAFLAGEKLPGIEPLIVK